MMHKIYPKFDGSNIVVIIVESSIMKYYYTLKLITIPSEVGVEMGGTGSGTGILQSIRSVCAT